MRRNVLSIISTLSLASVTQTRQASGLTRNLMISSRPLSYNTLIVSTTADAASLNIANALRESCSQWETYLTTEISSVYCTKAAPSLSESILSDHLVWLWVQNQPLLHLNNVDLLLNEELVSCGTAAERTNESIIFNEVIFLSKHCAASGKASLTVHPIGERNHLVFLLLIATVGRDPAPTSNCGIHQAQTMDQYNTFPGIPWMVDASDSGGFPGRCSPPNRRIAELYRLVLAETKSRSDNFNPFTIYFLE